MCARFLVEVVSNREHFCFCLSIWRPRKALECPGTAFSFEKRTCKLYFLASLVFKSFSNVTNQGNHQIIARQPATWPTAKEKTKVEEETPEHRYDGLLWPVEDTFQTVLRNLWMLGSLHCCSLGWVCNKHLRATELLYKTYFRFFFAWLSWHTWLR